MSRDSQCQPPLKKSKTDEGPVLGNVKLPEPLILEVFSYLPDMQMMLWAYGLQLLSQPKAWFSDLDKYNHGKRVQTVSFNGIKFVGLRLLSDILSAGGVSELCNRIEDWAKSPSDNCKEDQASKKKIINYPARGLARVSLFCHETPEKVLKKDLEEILLSDTLACNLPNEPTVMKRIRTTCDYVSDERIAQRVDQSSAGHYLVMAMKLSLIHI